MKFPQLPSLPENHEQATLTEALQLRKDLRSSNFGDVLESERFVKRGTQTFAILGGYAYDIADLDYYDTDTGNWWIYRPAVAEGKVYYKAPDEGDCGILYWFWTDKVRSGGLPKGWNLLWIGCGYIHTSELDLTDAEIAENIMQEVDRGETPLTGFSSKPQYQ